MKRVVLFDKKNQEPAKPFTKQEKKEPKTEVKKTAQTPKLEKGPNISIIEWIKTHELLKIRPLCELIGVDPATFHRWVNVKNEIPEEIIKKLTPILKDYGFNDSL